MATPLRQRLLQDIAELQAKPYPNVSLHVQDEDITKACLVLTVQGYGPMHLTVHFSTDYPLSPPQVQMDSNVTHPNIFGTYICASILNTVEGYTPAYTLKGIAIQLLSFFGSDKIEQAGGGYSVGLADYRDKGSSRMIDDYTCGKCRFGSSRPSTTSHRGSLGDYFTAQTRDYLARSDSGSDSHRSSSSSPNLNRNSRRRKGKQNKQPVVVTSDMAAQIPTPSSSNTTSNGTSNGISRVTKTLQTALIPDEILLIICEQLDFEELMAFAQSWPRIAELVPRYDIIRTRELQCFCFKKDYMNAGLGVGVAVAGTGRLGFFESEFDLLSLDAYRNHNIRRSVLGVEFDHWLPLPISYGHWRKVNGELSKSLSGLATAANLGNVSPVQVIFHFMNDIVVKLNQAADGASNARTKRSNSYIYYNEAATSSLTHASEKAIESYFHLFHLLLCMATTQPTIIQSANATLRSFLNGRTSKTDCPNLGHILVAALIADVPIDEKLLKAIIRETITRNVVWMLGSKPELSYLEPSEISEYRLQETFRASKTSYRLLMFLNLFRRTAVGSPRVKSLVQLRDEAFERHGAPPRGAAKGLADSIKRIHQINNFPDFLTSMGLEKPGAVWFTNFLRRCVVESGEKGYHRSPISQGEAFALRRTKEPGVELVKGLGGLPRCPDMRGKSFFPRNVGGGRGGNNRGGRTGRY